MRMVAALLFVIGIGVAGVFASRVARPEVAEGERPSPAARIGAWWDAAGIGFSIGAVMMIAGALIARRERGGSVGPDGAHATDAAVPELMAQILRELEAIPSDPGADTAATKARLDEVLEELVPKVLDRRDALVARMGLGPFAEMIGHFASMERNAARAWSALIDEAYDEIPPCVERAKSEIALAIEALEPARPAA